MPAQGYFGVRTPPGGGGVGPDLNNISFVFKNLNNLSPMVDPSLKNDVRNSDHIGSGRSI